MTVDRGRGGWTRYGMPDNNHDGVGDTRYYDWRAPEQVGLAGSQVNGDYKVVVFPSELYAEWGPDQALFDAFAVNQGVRQIQERINRMGWARKNPPLKVDGILSIVTDWALGWAQGSLGLKVDGVAGPTTIRHMFWPAILAACRFALANNTIDPYADAVAMAVAGIVQHESGWDPGAVGYSTPADLGFVQINGPANPEMSASDRFNYKLAFQYAAKRIDKAFKTPGFSMRTAVADYGYPAIAAYWVKTGTETWPQNPELNEHVIEFVDQVLAWRPT